MKKLLVFLIGLGLSSTSMVASAENLLQVYKQAKESNPELRKAAATRDAAYASARETKGSLLPQLGLSAEYNLSKGYRGNSDGVRTTNAAGSVVLNQTLFNMARWYGLSVAQKQAGLQDIIYNAQEKTLILKTASSYFNVLRALDTLSYIQSQKSSIAQQLQQTRQRFNVGLVAITDVHNAQAQHDQTLAEEVQRRNSVENALEELRQVTGVLYANLNPLDTRRFRTDKVPAVDLLLQQAESNNLDLLASKLSQDAYREQIRASKSGHYPTLDLRASSGLGNNDSRQGPLRDSQNTGAHQVGVSLNVPLYTGGSTQARVKQAQANFVGASQDLESAHRKLILNVRSSHNNISAAISTVSAYNQTVKSAESSLQATRSGYNVGTRTIVDVLNATTVLYNAKTQLANARYDYLISVLTLKSALGTLNEKDLSDLNQLLGNAISTIAY